MTVAQRAALNVQLRHKAIAGHAAYRDNPVGFVEDVLKEHLWSKQREIAESVRDNQYTAVPSCHDSGKSFLAARLTAWWLETRPVGEAFVVTSAPTEEQVKVVLWREIGHAHRRAHLRGRVTQKEWHMPAGGGEEIVAYGRKPADYNPDAFQGIHAKYVLVILDEAGGVPRSLFQAAETITTNEHSRILAIGNPDHPGTQFQTVTQSPDWHTIHISADETPNFTDEEVPDYLPELMLSPHWVETQARQYGTDSPRYISKVMGRFPQRPAGAVYEVDPGIHLWTGPLPPFKKYVGGLDYGGQNIHDHGTAGIIGGITAKGARCGEDKLIRLDAFKDTGPKVYERFEAWMETWQRRVGKPIRWRADRSQMLGIDLMRRHGRDVLPSHGGPGSVNVGIGLVQARLGIDAMGNPGSFYTAECGAWLDEAFAYRWADAPEDPGKTVPKEPIKRNDDLMDADRYMAEEVDGFPGGTIGSVEIEHRHGPAPVPYRKGSLRDKMQKKAPRPRQGPARSG